MAPKCYKSTEYFRIIQNLCNKTRNSELSEKCPKCSTQVWSYYTLMVHIEKFHPNDVKHKPYLKHAPQLEETLSQTVDDFEMNDDNGVTINEEFPVFQTSDSIPDSFTLEQLKDNPFFKVTIFLI